MEPIAAPVSFLQDHQAVLAAPLRCSSYGELAPSEAVGLAVRGLRSFGFCLSPAPAELRDRRMLSRWTSDDETLSVAMAEDLVDHCCYLVVAGDSRESVARAAAALRGLLPLVEVHLHFDPFGALADERVGRELAA